MKNYFLQKRVGPTNEDLLQAIAKEGKKQAMTKLFKSFQRYFASIAGGKEIYQIAEKYFKG